MLVKAPVSPVSVVLLEAMVGVGSVAQQKPRAVTVLPPLEVTEEPAVAEVPVIAVTLVAASRAAVVSSSTAILSSVPEHEKKATVTAVKHRNNNIIFFML